MARFLHHDFVSPFRTRNQWILAFFWTAGLLSGIASVFFAGPEFSSLMRSTLYSSVSIVCLLLVISLPFLLSAFAVFLSGHMLIFPISFCKGFLVSFVSLGIISTYGCAGWLIRLLLCFSDLCALPLLYWFWLRCLERPGQHILRLVLFVMPPLFLIASIDHTVISPFLADLIYFIER